MKRLLAAFITGLLFVTVPVHVDAAAAASEEAIVSAVAWDPATGDVITHLCTRDGHAWTCTEYDDLYPGDVVEVTRDADGLPTFGRYTGWLSVDAGAVMVHRYSPAPGVWDAVPWTW